ncbi:hypothetical protein [Lebetimonas sp. JH292]|nr:hypothetical protein [Lebetimonas sp. JH292]
MGCSTTVLHLTIEMLLELPSEKRKKVFIVAGNANYYRNIKT